MRASSLVLGCVTAALLLACSDTTLPPPTSDKNYDDPYDPGSSSGNGVFPEGGGDANGRFCTADRDCPDTHRCVFAVDKGCGAAGECQPYTQVSGCEANVACGCDGKTVPLCAPEGYAPRPVASSGACAKDAGGGDSGNTDAGGGDSGADATADSGSADAASD